MIRDCLHRKRMEKVPAQYHQYLVSKWRVTSFSGSSFPEATIESRTGMSLAARPWEPQWASVAALVQFALIGHGSKDFRELENGAASEGPTKTCDSFQRVCFRFFSSMTNSAQALVLTLLLQAFQLKYSKAKKSTNDLNLLACDPAMVQQKAFAGIKNYYEQTEDLCNLVQASSQSLSTHKWQK